MRNGLAIIFLLLIIAASVPSHAEARIAGAKILKYDDGSAQAVFIIDGLQANATGTFAIVLLNNSIIINYTLSISVAGEGRFFENVTKFYYYTEIEKEDDGYNAQAKLEIVQNGSSLKVDSETKYKFSGSTVRIELDSQYEAEGPLFSSVIDSAYQALQALSNTSGAFGANVSLNVDIGEYKPGEKLAFKLYLEIPKQEEGIVSMSLEESALGLGGTALSDLIGGDWEEYNLTLQEAKSVLTIENGRAQMWGYAVYSGDVAKLASSPRVWSAIHSAWNSASSLTLLVGPNMLDIPGYVSSKLQSFEEELRNSSARVVLPTYLAIEADGSTVKIAWPRVKLEGGDTAELLKSKVASLGVDNVSVEKGDPGKPPVKLPEKAEEAYGGGGLSTETIALAAVLVIVLGAAAFLVFKARSMG